MQQCEISKELHLLYEQLLLEYPSYIEKAMTTLKFDRLQAEQWQLLKQDLTDNPKMKLEEFKARFSTIVLKFLQQINERIFGNHPYHDIHNLQNTSDLLQKSFFSLQDQGVARHPVLVELVLNVNDRVKLFYFHRRGKLEEILQARSANKNTNGTVRWKLPKRDEAPQAPKLIDLDGMPEPVVVAQQSMPKPQDLTRCSCNVLLRAPTNPHKTVECLMCAYTFHQACMKVPKPDLLCYVCPYCTIHNLDLFSPVQEAICPAQFFQITQPPAKNFQFTLKELPKTCQIQLRCLRIDEYHGLDEPTWPDYGEILVNGVRLFDFKPLAQNTSLKKRKDSVYVLREKIKIGEANFVTLRELKPSAQEQAQMRVSSGQTYIAGIFLVQVQTAEALIKRLKKDRTLWMSQEQGKQMIREKQLELVANVDGIQADKLKVSLACPFTMQRIETPARGNICSHVQCFSLENMVKMTFQTPHRKWRCPICKRKCFKIFLDDYQQHVITMLKAKNVKENDVTFKENGDVDENQFVSAHSSQQTNDDPPSPKAPRQHAPAPKGEIIIDEEDVGEQIVKKIKTSSAKHHQPTADIILIDD